MGYICQEKSLESLKTALCRFVQIGVDWCRFVQIGVDWFRFVQIGVDLFGFVRNGSECCPLFENGLLYLCSAFQYLGA